MRATLSRTTCCRNGCVARDLAHPFPATQGRSRQKCGKDARPTCSRNNFIAIMAAKRCAWSPCCRTTLIARDLAHAFKASSATKGRSRQKRAQHFHGPRAFNTASSPESLHTLYRPQKAACGKNACGNYAADVPSKRPHHRRLCTPLPGHNRDEVARNSFATDALSKLLRRL